MRTLALFVMTAAASGSVVHAQARQTLALPDAAVGTTVVTLSFGGHEHTVRLRPDSLRAAGFSVGLQGADGSIERVAAPAARTVRGTFDAAPEARLSGSLDGGALRALASLDGATWVIEPLADLAPHDGLRDHVVRRGDDVDTTGLVCGTPDSAFAQLGAAAGADGVTVPITTAQLAIDTDVQYFEWVGGTVESAVHDVEAVIAGSELLFERDLGVNFELTEILVRTAEPDPYDVGGSTSLLFQATNEWWGDPPTAAPHDVVQVFLVQGLVGASGLASPVFLCNGSFPGASVVLTNAPNDFGGRAWLHAHELGHSFGAGHCTTADDCGVMCAAASCGGDFFGSASQAAVAAVLGDPDCAFPTSPLEPPVVTSITPTEAAAFSPPELVIEGSSLATTTVIRVGDQSLTPDDFTLALDGTLRAPLDPPTALGPVDVDVTNPVDVSAPTTFTWIGSTPPVHSTHSIAVTGFEMVIAWGADADQTVLLLVSPDAATTMIAGSPVLTSHAVALVTTVDAVGLGGLTVSVPAVAAGIRVWTQVAAFGDAFAGTSQPIETWIVF